MLFPWEVIFKQQKKHTNRALFLLGSEFFRWEVMLKQQKKHTTLWWEMSFLSQQKNQKTCVLCFFRWEIICFCKVCSLRWEINHFFFMKNACYFHWELRFLTKKNKKMCSVHLEMSFFVGKSLSFRKKNRKTRVLSIGK